MLKIFMAVVMALSIGIGCAKTDGTSTNAQPQMDLTSFKACFEHVLRVMPDYMGGNEQFVEQLSLLGDVEGEHAICDGVPIENGLVKLSTGEPVEIIRLKSDFRCPCMSIWLPYYMLTTGDGQSITVQHPDTPKSCEEVCPQGKPAE